MRKQINNSRFSVRFCFVMKALGINTIGQAKRFLDRVDRNCKIQGVRMYRLQQELKEFLNQ